MKFRFLLSPDAWDYLAEDSTLVAEENRACIALVAKGNRICGAPKYVKDDDNEKHWVAAAAGASYGLSIPGFRGVRRGAL